MNEVELRLECVRIAIDHRVSLPDASGSDGLTVDLAKQIYAFATETKG